MTLMPQRNQEKFWTSTWNWKYNIPEFITCSEGYNKREVYMAKKLLRWFSDKQHACQCRDPGDLGLIPGLGRSLKKEMMTHLSILSWEIPWTEEPDGLQSMGCKESDIIEHTHMHVAKWWPQKGKRSPIRNYFYIVRKERENKLNSALAEQKN